MKILTPYGLKPVKTEVVDLRTCYSQCRPNQPIDELLLVNGKVDRNMMNSPHFEFANFYYSNEKHLRNIFSHTRYAKMLRLFGREPIFPEKFAQLCDSIKAGYLRRKHEENYIVILMESFARSRYNRDDVLNLVPEVWSGHHRIGSLLALGRYSAKVCIAEDIAKGTKMSYGKIHFLCIK